MFLVAAKLGGAAVVAAAVPSVLRSATECSVCDVAAIPAVAATDVHVVVAVLDPQSVASVPPNDEDLLGSPLLVKLADAAVAAAATAAEVAQSVASAAEVAAVATAAETADAATVGASTDAGDAVASAASAGEAGRSHSTSSWHTGSSMLVHAPRSKVVGFMLVRRK